MLDELATTDDQRALRLLWENEPETVLTAEELRRAARDATSIRQLVDHGEIDIPPGLTITALHAVGSYGVNVHFSDGHEKAIYPFSYLRKLSNEFGN